MIFPFSVVKAKIKEAVTALTRELLMLEARGDYAGAAEMAKGYSGLLAIGQLLKRGRDEEMLYKSTKITAEENKILVNFSMPRQTASEMLKKQLPAS